MLRALGNMVLAIVCTAVVGVVVITNTASPSSSSAAPQPASYVVTLDHPAGIGAENEYLAQLGARIRIVPLDSRCGIAGRMRPGHVAPRGRRALVPWVREVVAVQAPPGSTTIILVSPHGLDSASFQVRGRGPACVPAIATVPYWR